jgi:hypothetical protein
MKIPSITVHPDPIAAVIGAVIVILANTGVIQRLGLTADEVSTIGGACVTLAATLRATMRRPRE